MKKRIYSLIASHLQLLVFTDPAIISDPSNLAWVGMQSLTMVWVNGCLEQLRWTQSTSQRACLLNKARVSRATTRESRTTSKIASLARWPVKSKEMLARPRTWSFWSQLNWMPSNWSFFFFGCKDEKKENQQEM